MPNYALSRYYNLRNIVIMYESFVLGADENGSIRIFHLSFWILNSQVILNEPSLVEVIKLRGHWTISWEFLNFSWKDKCIYMGIT